MMLLNIFQINAFLRQIKTSNTKTTFKAFALLNVIAPSIDRESYIPGLSIPLIGLVLAGLIIGIKIMKDYLDALAEKKKQEYEKTHCFCGEESSDFQIPKANHCFIVKRIHYAFFHTFIKRTWHYIPNRIKNILNPSYEIYRFVPSLIGPYGRYNIERAVITEKELVYFDISPSNYLIAKRTFKSYLYRHVFREQEEQIYRRMLAGFRSVPYGRPRCIMKSNVCLKHRIKFLGRFIQSERFYFDGGTTIEDNFQ